jgi:hypothetical protein
VSEDLCTRLSRWSQRKLAVRRGEAVEQTPRDEREPDAPGASAEQSAEGTPPVTEETPLLPPIEELTRDSDYTVFLAKNVPEDLRREALRKLWRSDPVFSVLDDLNDYCEDFNVTDTPITMAQTAYKVGKSYFDEIVEKLEPGADGSPERRESDANADAAEGEIGTGSAENEKNILAAGDDGAAAPRQVGKAADVRCPGGQLKDGDS